MRAWPHTLMRFLSTCAVRGLAGSCAALLVVAVAPPVEGSPDVVRRVEMADPGPAAAPTQTGQGWWSRLVEALVCAPVTECEYFLLAPEVKAGGEAPAALGGGQALIAQRRVVRGTERLLEREVLFEEGSLRVLHTERIKGQRRTLTYREIQPTGARTWLAEWDVRGGTGRVLGYGWHRPTHESFEAPAGLMGPLQMLEGLRANRGTSGRRDAMVLDPLAANTSQLTVEVLPGSETVPDTLRALRPDGTLVVEARARIGEGPLSSLRLTGGCRVARAISREEFERRHELWNRPRVPAHERALAALAGKR